MLNAFNIMKRLLLSASILRIIYSQFKFVLLMLEIMPNFHKKVGQRESDMKKEKMKET